MAYFNPYTNANQQNGNIGPYSPGYMNLPSTQINNAVGSAYQQPLASSPVQTNNTTSGSNYQQQWNQAGHQGQVPVGYHGESTPSIQGVDPSQIDAIYNPLMSSIDAQEANQQGQLGTTLGQIQSAGNSQLGALDLTNQQQQTLTDQQSAALQQNQQSALDQASRNYNWAKQGALDTYGYNGAFLGSDMLARQELAYQQGQVNQTSQQSLGQLLSAQQNVFAYSAQKKADIQSWVQTQQQQAKQTLQDNLTQLEQSRFSAASDKAKMQLQSIQQLHDAYNNIQLQAYQSQLALQQWQSEYQTQIQSQLQAYNQSVPNYTTTNPFASQVNPRDYYNSGNNTSALPASSATALLPNRSTDQFGNLISPTA